MVTIGPFSFPEQKDAEWNLTKSASILKVSQESVLLIGFGAGAEIYDDAIILPTDELFQQKVIVFFLIFSRFLLLFSDKEDTNVKIKEVEAAYKGNGFLLVS
ncbi:hypothetical protein NC652_027815 [Populus alba x Populus x berolinensis]|nr:hypothetical protein NC652_027815 [Populus alba x Populus x berolinensis]